VQVVLVVQVDQMEFPTGRQEVRVEMEARLVGLQVARVETEDLVVQGFLPSNRVEIVVKQAVQQVVQRADLPVARVEMVVPGFLPSRRMEMVVRVEMVVLVVPGFLPSRRMVMVVLVEMVGLVVPGFLPSRRVVMVVRVEATVP
jgi:hypothetical protein